jgi:hypothetical protein
MSGHKRDDSMATGKHRPWAGEPGSSIVRASSPLRDPHRKWPDRTPAAPLPANPRHAAITRSLYSWTNYKSWTDKINKSWEKDKSGK